MLGGGGRGGELRRDERPLGTQGGTGQGHGSQRWLTGQGGGFCGLSTKEKQVEGSAREGRRGMGAGGKSFSPHFCFTHPPAPSPSQVYSAEGQGLCGAG